jgi:hypothetical protein
LENDYDSNDVIADYRDRKEVLQLVEDPIVGQEDAKWD